MNISRLFRYATPTTLVVLLSLCGLVHAGGLTLGHPYSMGSRAEQWANDLSSCIEGISGIPVRIFDRERLGEPSDIFNSVASGRIDFALLPTSEIGAVGREISALRNLEISYRPKFTVEISNSEGFLDEINMSSYEAELKLIGIGWQYGALVMEDAILNLKNLRGMKVAGGDSVTNKVVESLGGYTVSIEDYDIFPALADGYVDSVIVDEAALQWGIENGKFQSIFWSRDFAPIASPIAVVMNNKTFGDDLAFRISTKCRDVTRGYNEVSVDMMNGIPEIAEKAGIRVMEISYDAQKLWGRAMYDAIYSPVN